MGVVLRDGSQFASAYESPKLAADPNTRGPLPNHNFDIPIIFPVVQCMNDAAINPRATAQYR